MTAPSAVGRAEIDAALVLLSRMGITPEDLVGMAAPRPAAPTFAAYVPVVAAAVSAASRRAYGSYWNRLLEHWGQRRIDEPSPSEIQALAEQIRAGAVVRRNGRGGRSTVENFITALRCLYRHAVADGYLISQVGRIVFPPPVASRPAYRAPLTRFTALRHEPGSAPPDPWWE